MTQKTVFAIIAIMIANLAFAEIIDVGSFDTNGTAYDVWVGIISLNQRTN